MKTTLALFVAAFALTAHADLSAVSFLAGCRSLQNGDVKISENWSKPTSNLMQGISQTVDSKNKAVEYEFLRIEQRVDGTVAYTPYVNGKQAADFIFDPQLSQDLSFHRAVFVNEENDFPKRISYSQSKTDDSQLLIHLEGVDQHGSPQLVEFPLFRTECNIGF